MIKRVKIYPTNRGIEWIRKRKKEKSGANTAVISITDPYEKEGDEIEPGGPVGKVLHLSFFDLNPKEETRKMSFGLKKYIHKFSPGKEDLDGLKEFIDGLGEEIETLLVLCPSGISRSPAIAAAITEYIGFPDVVFCTRKYQPNPYIYQLALKEFGIEMESWF